MNSSLADRVNEAMKGPPPIKGAALAAACGVKPPSVSDWRNGRTKEIKGLPLIKAAAFLGVNVKWLAEGVGPMRPAPTIGNAQVTPSEILSLQVSPLDAALQVLADALARITSSHRREQAALLLSSLAKNPKTFGEIREDLNFLLGNVSPKASKVSQTVLKETQIPTPPNMRRHGSDFPVPAKKAK